MSSDDNGIPNFSYGPADLIYRSPTWEDFTSNPQLSEFDRLLGDRWEEAMAQGAFNYTFDVKKKKERVIPGKHQYVMSLALQREKKRRAPQVMKKVNMPFDPEKFHFNKVKPVEILMNMCGGSASGDPEGGLTQNGTAEISRAGPEQVHNGAEPGQKTVGKNIIVINSSPFEYGHVLLTPDVDLCIQQRITLRGMKLALEMMLLSNHPGLRIAFNGLCALASVNHQHFHGWYVDTPLQIEHTNVKHVGGLCHETTDIFSRAMIFQLHGTTTEKLARAVFTTTNYFQENEIAHNLFMVRGVVFGEPADSKLTTVRVLVWPRKKEIGSKGEYSEVPVFHVAVAELAGQIPMYQADRFDDLTEDEITTRIKGSLFSKEEFDKICDNVKALMVTLETS